MTKLSKLFGNEHIRPILPGSVDPAESRTPYMDRQADAGQALLGSYTERAENSVAKVQEHWAAAAASMLRR
jgi:hypothetical protein